MMVPKLFLCHMVALAAVLVAVQGTTDVTILRHWLGGFQGQMCIPITKELRGWKVHLKFDHDVNSVQVWVATATRVSSREYVLENKAYNNVEHVGDKLCLTFIGTANGDVAPQTTAYIEGMDGGGNEGGGSGNSHVGNGHHHSTHAPLPDTGGGSASKDYAKALSKSILFFDAQRSGKLPVNNPIPWRGDSALNDCVPGGWYDAGDHVKFGLPMASSTTLLLWSLNKFKDGYVKAGQLSNMYDMIRWPLNYFLDAWNPSKKDLVIQVGDGNADHSYWGRPEDMRMQRPCQHYRQGTKGSDIGAETAAAMALGSIVFKDKGDHGYATRLLTAAESLYAFSKSHRGVFGGAAPFYTSSGDKDELCEASIWLYRATNNNQYLNDAKQFVETAWAWALSWDDKKVACQALLYETTQDSRYKQPVVGFFKNWFPGGQTKYTPCGLAWKDRWGSNRYAGNAAFMALLAAEMGINTASYRKWAVEQINYLLGDNNHDGGCFSFEIGYGSKYPTHPHHRGASCPAPPASCANMLTDPRPSPHILQGALVGGPNANGQYRDDRTDYRQNEVATDFNSGFQGALAGIVHLVHTNNLPVTHNKCPCKS